MFNGRRVRSLLLGLAACTVLCASKAQATIWDYNFSGASGGAIADVLGIQEAQFLAGSVLGFRDGGAGPAGEISAGDTFRDFTMLRVTGFTDSAGDNLTPTDYGSGPGRTHEITIKTVFSGVQLTANTYQVTAIDLFEVYFDATHDGYIYTSSSFPNLTTFQDFNPFLSGHVEEGELGGPSGGVNSGPFAPDGTIDVVVRLFDLLHEMVNTVGEYFEVDSVTGQGLDTEGNEIAIAVFDANNLATPPGQTLGGLNAGTTIGGTLIVAGYADVFGPDFGLAGVQNPDGTIVSLSDNNGAFDFAFQTRSDGSFVKATQVIPEPATFVIWGSLTTLGLLAARRRKRNVA